MSKSMNVEPKKSSRTKKNLATLLVVALALAATVAWSQQIGPSPTSFFGNGGPWTAVSNEPECMAQGRVCAEWPFRSAGQTYLAVCCIVPSDLGSSKPPENACASGGMLMIRRGD